jgi:hypothetical protein
MVNTVNLLFEGEIVNHKRRNELAYPEHLLFWTKVINGEEVDHAEYNQPLCMKFFLNVRDVCGGIGVPAGNYTKPVCVGCMIDKFTGNGCNGTPYEDWCKHQLNKHGGLPFKVECPECRDLAIDWFEWLKQLEEAKDEN